MKTIYIILLLVISGTLNAQTNFLPADSAITWTGVTTGFYGGPGNISYYWNQFSVDSTNNDTVINSLKYTKLNNQSNYYACFRSDTLNQSLYFMPKDYVDEYLFFDYSLNYEIGDTVFIPHYNQPETISGVYFKLIEIDSNLIINNYYKTYNFERLNIVNALTNLFASPPSEYINIAERMITGSSFPFFGEGSFETFYNLSCYQENGVFHWNNGGTCPLLDFTSVNENKQSKLTIYPNPSTGLFTIELENVEMSKISIYDLNGKIVFINNSNVNQIDLSHLNKGIYILELETPSQLIQEKIIIE